jgi:tRNA(Ile)-lysidine synthase
MRLFADWAARESARPPTVLVVDHDLRPESEGEAALAARWAKALGLPVNVLHWQGRKPVSNIEDQARRARYRLLGGWCANHGVANLFLAHTREDQAETFLLRLGRGSGVDGLSGMRARGPLPVAGFGAVHLLRPLLDIGRGELRAYLQSQGASWLEDPMNADSRYARVRVRKALPQLEAAGVPALRLAEAARHLARAREALEASTEDFLGGHARIEPNFALLDAVALLGSHREIGLRALCAVLMRVSGKAYRPRFERLEALYEAISAGGFTARTLMGCRVGKAPKTQAAFGPGTLLVAREGARRTGLSDINANDAASDHSTAVKCIGNPKNPPQKGRIRPL